MSAEERDRPRAWHQSPSMSELLASCAAADAVSQPPERPGVAGVTEQPGDARDDAPQDVPAPYRERRDAA